METFIPDSSVKDKFTNPTEQQTQKKTINILEKSATNEKQLPKDENQEFLIDPYPSGPAVPSTRKSRFFISKVSYDNCEEGEKGKRISAKDYLNPKIMQFGYRTANMNDSVCKSQFSISKNNPTSNIADNDLTESANKITYKFKYGKRDTVNENVVKTMGVDNLLVVGNAQLEEYPEPIVSRGVFGFDNGSWAGFQKWEQENPMLLRNSAVSYPPISGGGNLG